MDSPSETTSSKLIQVLNRIDTTLSTLDQRLQALEDSWNALPSRSSSSIATPVGQPNGVQRTPKTTEIIKHTHTGFVTKHQVNPDGSTQLQEIIVEEGELLSLLLRIPSPCLNRHQTEECGHLEHKAFRFPLAQLLPYRNILRFIERTGRLDSELRALYSNQMLTPQLTQAIAGLLACCDAHSAESANIWGVDAARGWVLFDELPGIFAPGTLLIESGDAGREQIIEVSSCHTVAASASEACVIEGWHFRWDGAAFSRTCVRFSIDSYGGARPVDGLLYHPIVGSDPDKSIEVLERLVCRKRAALDILKALSKVEVGDFPLCKWKSPSSQGTAYRKPAGEQVVLDPEAFLANNKDGSIPGSTFCCYCTTCTTSMSFENLSRNIRYLLLSPTRVGGYLLGSKRWATLAIDDLQPGELGYADRSLDTELDVLQLDRSLKASIKNDFVRYFAERKKFMDKKEKSGDGFVHDYGRGLFFHFHGARGVGKGLLTELLAAHCRRPILLLRPADLGLEPRLFSENLSYYSELSCHWGAILVFAKAKYLLQPRKPDDMTGNALLAALTHKLKRFDGVIVFQSRDVTTLDRALVPYIRQVEITLPSPKGVKETIFITELDRVEQHGSISAETREEIVRWIKRNAENLGLSGRDVREIFSGAVGRANAQDRSLTLDDILEAYSARTGRPNEWDFVTETSACDNAASAVVNVAPEITESLLDAFGDACCIPDDGRLPLRFSKSFYSSRTPDQGKPIIKFVAKLTNALQEEGRLKVVDWGWPRGLWAPTEGCVYEPRRGRRTSNAAQAPLQQRGQDEKFTCGLRHLIDSDEHREARCGKPWRRLVLIQGLEALDDAMYAILRMRDPFFNSAWFEFGAFGESRRSFEYCFQALEWHVWAITPTLEFTYRNPASISHVQFHIAFFQLFHYSNTKDTFNTSRFFDWPGVKMRKACFTMFNVPRTVEDVLMDQDDPIHWTIVCLTPAYSWDNQNVYTVCEAPTLRAQSTHYVADALARVVNCWLGVASWVEALADSSHVLRVQERLQDILFDDDAFSMSKRYFWAINFLHEAIGLLNETIQQWEQYRRSAVEPYRSPLSGREEYWYRMSQEVLVKAEEKAENACKEPKQVRQKLQDKLARITVLRDGLFNASAVMESRASTKLGENVKLLTFVSIFFLPLGLCVAIWSINESYSRVDLVIVTAIVAVATYLITMNLNNLARGLRKTYGPKRRRLIEQMEQDPRPEWRMLGDRFKTYQRSEKGQMEPSEWMIVIFLLSQKMAVLRDALSRTKAKVRGRLTWFMRHLQRRGAAS